MPQQEAIVACPVCAAENSVHATVCVSCGSFIQNRIPTLDLFQTAWGVLEHPVRTYQAIARAEHKNYAVFLFALGGILPAMACFHMFRIGSFFPSLILLIPLGVITGVLLGSITAPLGGGIVALFSRLVGGDGSYKNALGATAYAFVPSIAFGIVTLPIQWLTFGEFQYTLNPHPETINAVSYWILNGLQWLAAGWSIVLLMQGVRVTMRLSWVRSIVPTVAMILFAGGVWLVLFSVGVLGLRGAGVYYVY